MKAFVAELTNDKSPSALNPKIHTNIHTYIHTHTRTSNKVATLRRRRRPSARRRRDCNAKA